MLTMTFEDSPSSTSAGSRPRGSAPCAYVNVSTVAGAAVLVVVAAGAVQPARAATHRAATSTSESKRTDFFISTPSSLWTFVCGGPPSVTIRPPYEPWSAECIASGTGSETVVTSSKGSAGAVLYQ